MQYPRAHSPRGFKDPEAITETGTTYGREPQTAAGNGEARFARERPPTTIFRP